MHLLTIVLCHQFHLKQFGGIIHDKHDIFIAKNVLYV